MKVETLMKVLDDSKKVSFIDPIYGEVHTYKNCKCIGVGYKNLRVVMVTLSRTDEETINIVVKPSKEQESELNDEG